MRRLLALLLALLVAGPVFADGKFQFLKKKPAAGGNLFFDGFETNNFSLWTEEVDAGNNLSTSNTVAYGGSTYSQKAVKADNDNNYYVRKDLGLGYTDLWYHFYVYWNEISSAAPLSAGWYAVVSVKDTDNIANAVWIAVQVDTATPRKIRRIAVWYRNAAGNMQNLNGSNSFPNAATWYEVKVQVKKSTTDTSADGIVKAWFGGTAVVDNTALNMYSTFAMQHPRLGLTYMDSLGSWSTLIQYVDNFQIATSDIW